MTHEVPGRRRFLGATLGALAGAGLTAGLVRRAAAAQDASAEGAADAGAPVEGAPARSDSLTAPVIQAGDTILFQGDSITDAGRDKSIVDQPNSQPAFGNGYAWLAACGLLVDRPGEELAVYNRGISGNKVFQLAERWDVDCLELQPDVLSILIGVNDIWHARGGGYDGTAEVYERDYHALLKRTRTALPDVKLVICEPFVLRCGAVDDSWFPEFDAYRAAAARVAQEHDATWVGFQTMFDEAVRYAPPEHWAGDGVHPTGAGSALMAQAWLRAVGA